MRAIKALVMMLLGICVVLLVVAIWSLSPDGQMRLVNPHAASHQTLEASVKGIERTVADINQRLDEIQHSPLFDELVELAKEDPTSEDVIELRSYFKQAYMVLSSEYGGLNVLSRIGKNVLVQTEEAHQSFPDFNRADQGGLVSASSGASFLAWSVTSTTSDLVTHMALDVRSLKLPKGQKLEAGLQQEDQLDSLSVPVAGPLEQLELIVTAQQPFPMNKALQVLLIFALASVGLTTLLALRLH